LGWGRRSFFIGRGVLPLPLCRRRGEAFFLPLLSRAGEDFFAPASGGEYSALPFPFFGMDVVEVVVSFSFLSPLPPLKAEKRRSLMESHRVMWYVLVLLLVEQRRHLPLRLLPLPFQKGQSLPPFSPPGMGARTEIIFLYKKTINNSLFPFFSDNKIHS